MDYQIFLIIAPFSIGLLVATAYRIYKYKSLEHARTLLLFYIAVGLYLLSNISELMLRTPDSTLLSAKTGHLFFGLIPVIWFKFALQHSGHHRLARSGYFYLFYSIPLITNILIHTNNLHHLIYKELLFFKVENFLTFKAEYGPWMWITGVYYDLLYLTGILLIISAALKSSRLFIRQTIFIATGVIVPVIFNALYVFHAFPFLRKDFTAVSFAFTAVMSYIGIDRYDLFRIIPIARDRIFRKLESGVILIDSACRILDLNISASIATGISEDSINGTEQETLIIRKLLECNKNGMNYSVNNREYKILVNELRLNKITSGFNLISIIDVTHEYNLMAELKSANSIIIQQEKLSTIGQMTAGLAHEINNPLSYVSNNLFILKTRWDNDFRTRSSKFLDASEIEFLDSIIEDSSEGLQRVNSILRDLLDFSRPAAGSSDKSYDFQNGIKKCLSMINSEIKEIDEVITDLKHTAEPECRENEINQVLLNILSNAISAIKERKLIGDADYRSQLIIKTRTDDEFLYCEIANNGLSVSESDIPKLFDPFFTTKSAGQGTGLGLAIVREIIENRYKGRIIFRQDELTAFIFSIPLLHFSRKREEN